MQARVFLEQEQQAQGAVGERRKEGGKFQKLGPSWQNPKRRQGRHPCVVYTPCIMPQTVNMVDFVPMIRLYYIIQLAFRKKDYLSRSDLINEPRGQRQRQSEIQIVSRIPCTISVLKLEGDYVTRDMDDLMEMRSDLAGSQPGNGGSVLHM